MAKSKNKGKREVKKPKKGASIVAKGARSTAPAATTTAISDGTGFAS